MNKCFLLLVSLYLASSSCFTWTSVSAPNRTYHGGAVVGDVAYFGGGLDRDENITDTIQVFNLTKPKFDIGMTAVNGHVLFGGGSTEDLSDSSIFDNLDTRTMTFTRVNVTNGYSSRFGAITVGDLAVFSGGIGFNSRAVLTVFNATSNTFREVRYSTLRFSLAAVSVGGLGFFAGGEYLQRLSNVDIFDPRTMNCTLSSLSVARSELAGAGVGNLAIFAGGFGPRNATYSVVDIYNVQTQSWTVTELSLARGGLAGTSVNNFAIFAGGYVPRRLATNVVDIYNSLTNTWIVDLLPIPAGDAMAVSVGNFAVVYGFDQIMIMDSTSMSSGITQRSVSATARSISSVQTTATSAPTSSTATSSPRSSSTSAPDSSNAEKVGIMVTVLFSIAFF